MHHGYYPSNDYEGKEMTLRIILMKQKKSS